MKKVIIAAPVAIALIAGCGVSGGRGSPAATVTRTVTVAPSAAAKPKTSAPPAVHVLVDTSGTGNYNSPPFTVTGSNPVLVVTYSYSGNTLGGQADNAMIDVESSSDDQSVINAIAASGSGTTRVYPEIDGGSDIYHVAIQVDGPWAIKITQTG